MFTHDTDRMKFENWARKTKRDRVNDERAAR